MPALDGSLLGAACLINDLSALEHIRLQQELRALELRTSLTTISGYAQQLAKNRDPELAQQLGQLHGPRSRAARSQPGRILNREKFNRQRSVEAASASQG